MNLEALKLKLLYCLERAEEADRDRRRAPALAFRCRDLAVGHRSQGADPTPHARMGDRKERCQRQRAFAGGDKVAFPADYDKGVMFTTVDRPDNKQYREVFTSRAAIDAAKKEQRLPSGTVITLVQYAAKLDAAGNPEKDANGRFIKTNIIGYAVMEKRTGWGTEYPDNVRNGEWEYQAFKADKTQHRGQPHRLLQLSQAVRPAGLRVPLREDEGGEVSRQPEDRRRPGRATRLCFFCTPAPELDSDFRLARRFHKT